MQKFTDLDIRVFKGKTVILDIDGTLVPDKGEILEDDVLRKLTEMSKESKVFLCSNGLTERSRKMAEMHGVLCIETPHFKPDFRVLKNTDLSGDVVVVGDKYITDGLLALWVGAQFIRVSRVQGAEDRFLTKIAYRIDTLSGFFVHPLLHTRSYLKLLRPFQWIKNLLVLSPVFFAGAIFSPSIFAYALVATAVFCLVSSTTYIFNDISDVEQDRLHPTKKKRPIASGAVTLWEAKIMMGILGVIASIGIIFIPSILYVVLVYIFLNILYSATLKHVPVIDVLLVAVFYILRVLAGGFATNIYVSPWILLCVFFGSLFLIIGKRRGEYFYAERRKVLHRYSLTVLNWMLGISAFLSIVTYAIYSIVEHDSVYLVISSIFVVSAILRMLMRMYKNPIDAESPELLVFKDKIVFLSFVFWAAYIFYIFY